MKNAPNPFQPVICELRTEGYKQPQRPELLFRKTERYVDRRSGRVRHLTYTVRLITPERGQHIIAGETEGKTWGPVAVTLSNWRKNYKDEGVFKFLDSKADHGRGLYRLAVPQVL